MTTLADLVRSGDLEFSDGYRTKSSELAPEGFRIVRAGDIRDGRMFLDGPDFVASERGPFVGEKTVRAGDVVLTTKGTVGRTAFVSEIAESAVYSPQMCYFRFPSPSVLDPKYFYYWLQSPEFTRQAGYLKESSDMAPYISLRDLGKTHISLHASAVQQRFSEVLGALDERIVANNALKEHCDGLSSSIFAAMSLAEALPLVALARFVNGKAFTKDASGSGRMVVRIAELNSGEGVSTVYNELDVGEDHLARPGDILFSWSGSLVMRRWFYPEAIVNQHIFKVIPRPGLPKWLLAQLISRRLEFFRAVAADKTTTMGHIQRRHLELPVEVPPTAEVERCNGLMTALWERALAAEVESRILAQLRDTLLPALMSGRLSVRDAEDMVSEVV